MKILFVVQDIDYFDSIGLMLISAIAKSKGHQTNLAILSRQNIVNIIGRLKPDIVKIVKDKLYILDAKYYKIRHSYNGKFKVLNSPGVGDVIKQIFYDIVLSGKIKQDRKRKKLPLPKETVNAFVSPAAN